MKINVIEYYDNYTLESFFNSFKVRKQLINNLIQNKKILINNEIINNLQFKIYKNDILTIDFDIISISKKIDMKLDIIYEDNFIIVVNKKAHILIHSDGNNEITLTDIVQSYMYNKTNNAYAYPVHRLDYDTTGIVIFAKNPLSLASLSVDIENHKLIKNYVCLCYNKFDKKSGTINKPIGKNRHNNLQVISKTGKEAITNYNVISNGDISKVNIYIEHGRKHQIRLHLSSINHPILGDKLYGKEDGNDLKLHFKKVKFIHPYTKEEIEIICEEVF